MPSSERIEAQPRTPGHWTRLAWLPIPLLLLLMAALWIADIRTPWPFPPLYWLLNYGPVILIVGFIVLPTIGAFLAHGHPGVLMLGCAMWVVALGVAVAAVAGPRSLDTAWASYNSAVLLSAMCQFAGVVIAYRRRDPLRGTAVDLLRGMLSHAPDQAAAGTLLAV